MSDTVTPIVRTVLLSEGKKTLQRSVLGRDLLDISSFAGGSAYNYVMQPSDKTPRGNTLFNAGRKYISQKVLNDDQIQIIMVVPEAYDRVGFGNIIIYSKDAQGKSQPFAGLVAPYLIVKPKSSPDADTNTFRYPGTRLIISLTLTYLDPDEIDTDISIQIVPPEYSNLPFFPDDDSLPAPSLNPHAQFIVNETARVGNVPSFVTKDAQDQYWAIPVLKQLNSPKFDTIDGNETFADRTDILWGGKFTTPDSEYDLIIGGGQDTESVDDDYIIYANED